ncbi:MAG TPA: DUF3794 domain-containing protein [Bacillota bacterium]|nr:DUF3794 domain-containing protein [Bacillota bacterium]
MAVLAETTAQVLVDDTITLPLPAEKIDEIVASIRDLQCHVIANKVIFQGTLHKQIFFVDLEGFVRHVGVDIPFSGFVDVPGVPAGSSCEVTGEVVFISFGLISPTELRETVVIDIGVTVFDTVVNPNVAVGTNAPVVAMTRFGVPGTVRVANGQIVNRF